MFENLKIISGGDANYFEQLKELTLSIREQPGGEKIDISFLYGALP